MSTVVLLSHTPDPEKLIAAAAKLCYSAKTIDNLMDGITPEIATNFMEMLLEIGHESPIEHVSFTFAIEGVSRALLAQITRHRIASFSVQSQRYVSKSDFAYITPPAIAENPETLAIYENAMQLASQNYDALATALTKNHTERLIALGEDPDTARKKAKKLANEDARFVLPNSCDTKMIVTMNARSLYNFFAHRCCHRAQWEIREVADKMLMEVLAVAPVLFARCGPPCLSKPCPEGKMSCGQAAAVREKYLRLSKGVLA